MAARPMYQQIAEDLQAQIESGLLEPGAQLPTELRVARPVQLFAEHHPRRNQAADKPGPVETRPGQGTFVTRGSTHSSTYCPVTLERAVTEVAAYLSEVSKSHRRAVVTNPKVEIQVPSAEITRRLRVPPNTQIVSRHEIRYIDGTPWSLQTSFYLMDFITKGATRLLMADDIREGAVSYLADTIGVRQVGYRDWITARVPDTSEQSFFGLAHDATVFEIFRTGFDQTGTPLRVTVTVFPADRNQFIVNVGNTPDPEYSQKDEADQLEEGSEPA